MSLAARVTEAITATGSILCLGLDPDVATAATAAIAEESCVRILGAAVEYAAAVKPNIAFFEQHGSAGLQALERLRARVPADRLFILDAKRGDIGTSATAYARLAFDVLDADAVTVNPLMGEDSVRPFLERPGHGAFVLTRTSNPGASDILELALADGSLVYEHIAALTDRWDVEGRAGFVVGATAPDAIATLRARHRHQPFLVPGVGAQGGELEAAVAAGLDADGTGVLVNVSRGISGAASPGLAARMWSGRLDDARRAALGA